MSLLHLDTSALAKLYLDEPVQEEVMQLAQALQPGGRQHYGLYRAVGCLFTSPGCRRNSMRSLSLWLLEQLAELRRSGKSTPNGSISPAALLFSLVPLGIADHKNRGLFTQNTLISAGMAVFLLLTGSVGEAGKTEGLAYYQQGQYGVALYELEGVAYQGDKDASLLVGLMYLRGQGTEKNFEKAVYWLQEASRLGSAEAYGHLGEMYLSGTGLPQSDQDAFYNADTAARAGYVPAQLLLGKLYLEGRGIERDPTAAREWFGKAAAEHDAEAQYRLAQLFETGEGGAKDPASALTSYKEAASNGYKAASEALQRLQPSASVAASPTTTAPAKINPTVPAPPAAPTARQRRIALLIANQDYHGNVPALKGPVNDVALLGKVLQDAGFQVITKSNLGLTDMKREVTRFLDSVDGNTVSLLYYSGHGVEIGGKNYLLPTDFELTPNMSAAEAQELSFDLAATYAHMTAQAEGSLNITILDACRDNPFKASSVKGVGSSGGLKGLDIPAGNGDGTIETFTAYAAESGQQARDALPGQSNSPYALALAQQIPVPGQVLEVAFRKVREQVIRQTQNAQKPMSYAGLSSEFIFVPAK